MQTIYVSNPIVSCNAEIDDVEKIRVNTEFPEALCVYVVAALMDLRTLTLQSAVYRFTAILVLPVRNR